MKKENFKNLIDTVKVILIGIVLSIGASYVSAVWYEFSGSTGSVSTTNNSPMPINVSSKYQTKFGSFILGPASNTTGDEVTEKLEVDGIVTTKGLTVSGNSIIYGDVHMASDTGNITGFGEVHSRYLKVNDAINVNSLLVSKDLQTTRVKTCPGTGDCTGDLYVDIGGILINSLNNNTTTPKRLCTDTNGKIIICP